MRRLFNNLFQSTTADEDKSNPSFSADTGSGKSRFLKSRSKSLAKPDNSVQLITSAATSLADSIQNILSNIANLSSENLSGYQQLLETLDDQYLSEAVLENIKSNQSESSNISLLMQHLDHPNFIEICYHVNLATGLYQALRLLRMLEIIQAKTGIEQFKLDPGVTFAASSNICKILEKLCSSPLTIEQLRQSLVKLLVFPLNSLPYCGKHIQLHSSWIVSAICKTGFTSQQVWFLHDSHYVNYALRSVSELIEFNQAASKEGSSSSSHPSPVQSHQKDVLLRGTGAETEGMWIEALKCVIEVINSSLTVSSALLNDLESMHGNKIFIYMLSKCATERFLKSLNIVSSFVFRSSKKEDETVSFNSVTAILYDFLKSSFDIEKGILTEDSIDDMVELGHHIVDANLIPAEKEYIIQGLSYAVLTMYSNDPTNCILLEEKYNLLPLLILFLPAISLPETMSAVLTTFNYICQCVESNSLALFLSLSASNSIMISVAINAENPLEKRTLSLQFMELSFASIEAISKSNSKYATIFMKHGFVKNVLCDSFEKLSNDLREGCVMDKITSAIFERLLHLVAELISKSPSVPEEIRKSGLNPILRSIVSVPAVHPGFSRNILLLFEELSKMDESYMEESIVNILRLISSDSLTREKLTCLYNSLWKILIMSDGRAIKYLKEGAADTAFFTLNLLQHTFSCEESEIQSEVFVALECLESILRFLSLYAFYLQDNLRDPLFLWKVAYGLVNCDIFKTSNYAIYGVSLIFEFITIFTREKAFLDNFCAEILISILEYLDESSLGNFLSCLLNYFQTNGMKYQLFYENQIIGRFFHKLFAEIKGKSELESLVFQLLTLVLQNYRSLELTLVCFKTVLRPIGCNLLDNIDWMNCFVNNLVNKEFRNESTTAIGVLPPGTNLVSPKLSFNREYLEPLFPELPLSTITNSTFFGKSPCISMPIPIFSKSISPSGTNEDSFSLGSLALLFNENTTFIPSNNISISCWFRFNSELLSSENFSKFPLFSLESVTDRIIISLELNFFHSEILVKFFNLENSREEIICFKLLSPLWNNNGIKFSDWTNVILTIKRNKRFTQSNQLISMVYFNGLLLPSIPLSASSSVMGAAPTSTPASSQKSSNVIDFDCLTVPQNGELRFGFSKQSWSPNTSTSSVNPNNFGRLSFGSFVIFSDALSLKQVILLYLKGPSYVGQYHSETELTEHLITLSTQILKVANHLSKNSVHFLEKTGMKGIEYIVEPKHEFHSDHIFEFDLASLPEPLVIISPNFVAEDKHVLTLLDQDNAAPNSSNKDSTGNKLAAFSQPRRFSLLNIMDLDNDSQIGVLTSPGTISYPLSIGTCITGIGSLDSLIPLILLAPDDKTVTSLLALMQQVIKENVTSLKKSQAYTYRILAFILHLLPNTHLSTATLQQLIQFGIESSPSNFPNVGSPSDIPPFSPTMSFSPHQDSLLLVDPLAVAHFIFNHHVWNHNNFSAFSFILRQLRIMIIDDRYKLLNLMRLSSLGFIRWVIFACLNTLMETHQSMIDDYNQTLDNTLSPNGSNSSKKKDVWQYQPRTSFEMADYRDEPEPFLKDANNIIRYLVSSELRSKDIELITNVIQFTLNIEEGYFTDDLNSSVLERLKQKNYRELAQIHPYCTYEMNSTGVQVDVSTDSHSSFYRFHFLNPFEFYRIYLLRLLTSLYDDTIEEIRKNKGSANPNSSNNNTAANADSNLDHFEIYREKCSPEWFLSILERSDEIATKSQILRLLAYFLEKDLRFTREFIEFKGFQVIYSLLSPVIQPIPILLPVFAMLFKIPMQLLLYPFQVKSVGKLSQLLELEECSSDLLFVTDSFWLMNYSLPLLSIFYECLIKILRRNEVMEGASNSLESSGKDYAFWGNKAEELMVGMLDSAIQHCAPFRRLMQHKLSIEIHLNALLSTTNAFSDYGTTIYGAGAGRESIDLTRTLDEDYMSPANRTNVTSPRETNPECLKDGQSGDERISSLPLNVAKGPGESLQRMIHYLLRQAIRDEDNPRMMYFLFTSSTTLLSSLAFERAYQLLIMNVLSEIAKESQGLDNQIIAAIIRNITYVIPLAKGLYFYDASIFELLKICISLIETISSMYEISEFNDQLQYIIRDLIGNSRYLSFILLSMVLGTQNTVTEKTISIDRLQLLSYLRAKLDYFFHPFYDDSIDSLISSSARYGAKSTSIVDEGLSLTAPAMLEALQGLTSSNSQRKNTSVTASGGTTASSQIAQIRNERNRVANNFCSYMACIAYNLVLDEEVSVRIEATRILAFLSKNKNSLMEQLVGNSSPFMQRISDIENLGVDIYHEGLSKLVPNSDGKYQLFLRGGTDDNESEENRFADFSFWISDNSGKCDFIFRSIEKTIYNIMPNLNFESEELVKNLKYKPRAKDLFSPETADNIKASLRRRQVGQDYGQKIARQLMTWKNEGIKELTTGAMLWKKSWSTLKASSLWGYGRIINEVPNDLQSHHHIRFGFVPYEKPKNESKTMNLHGKIIWKVDLCEGPERTCKKLVQDLNPYSPVLFGEIPQRSLNASGSVSPVPTSPDNNSANNYQFNTEGENIDDILQTMQKQGVLRRMSFGDQNQQLTFDDGINADYPSNESMIDSPAVNGMNMTRQSEIVAGSAMSKSKYYEEEEAPDNEKIIEGDQPLEEELMDRANDLEDDELPLNINTANLSATVNSSIGSATRSSKIFTAIKTSRSMMVKEIVKGIINANELKHCQVHNIERISGLETQKGIFVMTDHFLHLLVGFTVKDRNAKFADMQFEWIPSQATSKFNSGSSTKVSGPPRLSPEDIPDEFYPKYIWTELIQADSPYVKIPIEEVYSFFKRRHQLKYTALEIADIRGVAVLFSCESLEECDEILTSLLEKDLPASIFNKMIGLKNLQLLRGATNMYNRLITIFLSTITGFWQHGEITNFEYLMYINSAAGRSFLDLTQYPVFPWILCDYKSDELDLEDSTIYRDLSKPMGAIGMKRAQQYIERYSTMDDFYREGVEGASPPFHFGTHYSCAGYVLHYLVRLQPYTNMGLALQGGQFDKADRLFNNIESSWVSASAENLQDVRELIPEFFYLPEFLRNVNQFDLGMTQRDELINHVILPKWANNDPNQFIKLHRQALESKYVSENLHHWIDLIFGYKQRGKAAIEALNVFIHITYEGEVDLDAIDDPILQSATLSQINNFGQTPTKIFQKPHPKKFVPEVVKKMNDLVLVEPTALSWHAHLSPPLTIVGAPKFILLKCLFSGPATFQGIQFLKKIPQNPIIPIGDVRLLSRDRILACPSGSVFLPPLYKKIVRFQTLADGLTFQTIHTFAPRLETEKDIYYHEQLHNKRITCISICKSGEFIATGSEDLSVRIWQLTKQYGNIRKLVPVCNFIGHDASVTCLDISPEFNLVVSGSKDHQVILWDYRLQCMIRILPNHTGTIIAVSVNTISGNILTLTKEQLRIYHLNGDLIGYQNFIDPINNVSLASGSALIAPPVGEWQDGVVAVTGHQDGNVYLWKLSKKSFFNPTLPKDHDSIPTFIPNPSLFASPVSSPVLGGNRKGSSSPTRPNGTGNTSSEMRPQHPVYYNSCMAPAGGPYYTLYVSFVVPKTHKTEVTAIRLCSTNFTFTNAKVSKELINKAYEESRNLDLLIGDKEGTISRWTIAKLDQLPQSDLLSLIRHENYVSKS